MPNKNNKKSAKIKLRTPIYKNKLALLISVLAIGTVGAYLLSSSRAAEFGTSVVHPQASAQPTAWGKYIEVLKGYNGKIYSGYGDWNANSGPLSMSPFNPTTKTFESSELTMSSHYVDTFRIIKNKLYAISVDGGADYAVAHVDAAGKTVWENKTPVGMTHTFDLVEFGNELCMAGSAGTFGAIYCGTDDGPWRQVLQEGPLKGATADTFTRFYALGSLNGKLYAQAQDQNNTGVKLHTTVSFDGSRWSSAPSLSKNSFSSSGRYNNYNGQILMQGGGAGLATYTGKSLPVTILPNAWNYTIGDDNFVYAIIQDNINNDRRVIRSQNLKDWVYVGTTPINAISIEVFQGKVFVGTTDSKIYVSDTIVQQDTAPPTVTISSPTTESSFNQGVVIPVSISASDKVGVAKVEVMVDDNVIQTTNSVSQTTPYIYSWDTSSYSAGVHTIKAVAYDAANNVGTATEVNVNITGVSNKDTTPPTVTISSPTDGQVISTSIFGKNFTINANTSDDSGVIKSEIYVGSKLINSFNRGGAISTRWSLNKLPKGPYAITVVAYDKAGNKTTSSVSLTYK